MPKVSVIVPVYNVEEYLKECLNSIKNQTFKDFEVILINDGSTDSSGNICEEFSIEDKRFRVIHQPNRGIAEVRNRGIKEAKGVYSIHVDSDDYVEKDFLKEMYSEIAKINETDIVVCDFNEQIGHKKIKHIQKVPTEPTDMILEILSGKIHGALWNKMVRHSLYQDHELKINSDLCMCEDLLTVVKLLSHSTKVSYIDKALYNYRLNPVSYTQKRSKASFCSAFSVVRELEQILPDTYENRMALIQFKIIVRRDVMLFGRKFNLKNNYKETNPFVLRSNSIKSYQKVALWAEQNGLTTTSKFILAIRDLKKKYFS